MCVFFKFERVMVVDMVFGEMFFFFIFGVCVIVVGVGIVRLMLMLFLNKGGWGFGKGNWENGFCVKYFLNCLVICFWGIEDNKNKWLSL